MFFVFVVALHVLNGVSTETCTFEEVQTLPTFYTDTCTSIIIDSHTLTHLQSDDVASLPASCTEFRIQDGSLQSIAPDTFNATNIDDLRLPNNDLTFVPQLQVNFNKTLSGSYVTCT